MESSLAEELYPESLQLSKLQLGHSSTANASDDTVILSGSDEADFNSDDGSLWGGSDEEFVDREWRRIHKEFHKMGYLEGIVAVQQASAQDGFNIGFKQSILTGYHWGLVRGVTRQIYEGAVACLPNGLMERLIETRENRSRFQELHESVQSLSMTDVQKLFDRDMATKKSVQQVGNSEGSVIVAHSQEQSSDCSRLGNYFGELQSLLEFSEIKVQLAGLLETK